MKNLMAYKTHPKFNRTKKQTKNKQTKKKTQQKTKQNKIKQTNKQQQQQQQNTNIKCDEINIMTIAIWKLL